MKPKIKCHFRDIATAHDDGYHALITLKEDHNHGIHNPAGRDVTTSPVLRIDFEQGILETKNTVYTFDNKVLSR